MDGRRLKCVWKLKRGRVNRTGIRVRHPFLGVYIRVRPYRNPYTAPMPHLYRSYANLCPTPGAL